MFIFDNETIVDGLVRRVFLEVVHWVPLEVYQDCSEWDYVVCRFPFVPGFHVCELNDDDDDTDLREQILSSHKTLHEAMGICKVLLASGGAHYD